MTIPRSRPYGTSRLENFREIKKEKSNKGLVVALASVILLLAFFGPANAANDAHDHHGTHEQSDSSIEYVDPFYMEPIKKDLDKKDAKLSTELLIALPSEKNYKNSGHLYRPGYEQSLARKICSNAKSLKCKFKELRFDPRKSSIQSESALENIDVLIFESDFQMSAKAAESEFGVIASQFFHNGDNFALKSKFMKVESPWKKSLLVGTENDFKNQAMSLCKSIKAKCTYIVNEDFYPLAEKFDAGKMDLIIHSQSWMFYSKELEDRIAYELAKNKSTDESMIEK